MLITPTGRPHPLTLSFVSCLSWPDATTLILDLADPIILVRHCFLGTTRPGQVAVGPLRMSGVKRIMPPVALPAGVCYSQKDNDSPIHIWLLSNQPTKQLHIPPQQKQKRNPSANVCTVCSTTTSTTTTNYLRLPHSSSLSPQTHTHTHTHTQPTEKRRLS